MTKFRTEFNTSGYYSGQGVWIALEELSYIKADTAQEAIEYAIDWFVETGTPEEEARKYAWRAAEVIHDEYGEGYKEWEYKEEV